jgi:phosphatidylserine decarboxylase
MLANDESVDEFVGGTVYQAFLSALNYHHWHSPVSGTIEKAFVKPGTYYLGGRRRGGRIRLAPTTRRATSHTSLRGRCS